jgi:hypothetical protein
MKQSPLLLSILSVLSGCSESFEDKGCFDVPAEQMTCPAASQVSPSQLYLPYQCGDDLEIEEVLSGGTREDISVQTPETTPACCYRVEVSDSDPGSTCNIGRPYQQGTSSLQAPLHAGEARYRPRSARADAWAKAGAAEHASVAAFSRLALQLMAHGAPSELLSGVHRAAFDEVRHAEQCWALARRFGGERLAAGPFPFAGGIDVAISLSELAAAAVREGCLSETLGAHVAADAAEHAADPEVQRILRAIARDEERHAVLSFQLVAWALQAGGAEVLAAVQAALGEPWPKLDVHELAVRTGVDVALLERSAREGAEQVLAPAVAALLATARA